MYRIVIVEDEKLAADNLVRMIDNILPEYEIVARAESVKDASLALGNNNYDLIFFDIHLTDGTAFDVLEKVKPDKPIIFTTAFDQYVLRAFKYLSIDYLLKPLDESSLAEALHKFQTHFAQQAKSEINLDTLQKLLKGESTFKERFLVQYGKKLKPVSIDEISHFHSANKITFLSDESNKTYPIDHSLSQLEKELDPNQFFRINRQYIISRHAVQHMYMISPTKMKVILKSAPKLDMSVSIDRMAKFKNWMK